MGVWSKLQSGTLAVVDIDSLWECGLNLRHEVFKITSDYDHHHELWPDCLYDMCNGTKLATNKQKKDKNTGST